MEAACGNNNLLLLFALLLSASRGALRERVVVGGMFAAVHPAGCVRERRATRPARERAAILKAIIVAVGLRRGGSRLAAAPPHLARTWLAWGALCSPASRRAVASVL